MRGFTLIEVLIYMAILAFMLTGLFSSAIFLHDSVLRSERAAFALLEFLNERDSEDYGMHEI